MSDARPCIAAFDFDGTLTRRDSFMPFLRHFAGDRAFALKLARETLALAAYAVRLLPNHAAKERVLRRFFADVEEQRFAAAAEEFAHTRLASLLDPRALDRLRWHRAQGHRCILVSASIEDYLLPWARAEGFEKVIATVLERGPDNRLTGMIAGRNCYGPEKARRLLEHLGERERFVVYAYGDSRGDRELIALADRGFYRTMPPPGEATCN